MTIPKILTGCALSALLAGCAGMPPESRAYYFPKALTKVVVTQTVGCSDDNKQLYSIATATVTTSYEPDVSVPPETISYKISGGFLKDPDLGVTSVNDGRLSGINATNTGEAGTIIKDVAAIAIGVATHGAAGGTGGGGAGGGEAGGAAPAALSPVEQDCKNLQDLVKPAKPAADGSQPAKVLTLTYSVGLTYATDTAKYNDHDRNFEGGAIAIDPTNNPDNDTVGDDGNIVLQPDASSLVAYRKLTLIHKLLLIVPGKWWSIDGNAGWDGHSDWAEDPAPTVPYGYRKLKLNRVANLDLTIMGPGAFTSPTGEVLKPTPTSSIWAGQVLVPLHKYYPILIPQGAPFGQQNFALTLADPGSITKLEYGTHSGAADALNTAAAVNKSMPTRETQASELQYQSDLIYQQQRLAACKADATKCTGK